jgi:hypothetical protein
MLIATIPAARTHRQTGFLGQFTHCFVFIRACIREYILPFMLTSRDNFVSAATLITVAWRIASIDRRTAFRVASSSSESECDREHT